MGTGASVVGLDGASWHSSHIAADAAGLARRIGAHVTLIGVVAPIGGLDDVLAFAHLHWIGAALEPRPQLFDTVAANDPGPALDRFLDVSTVLVVGAPCRHRWILGGVAGDLVRRASWPILVVPVTSRRTCCTRVDLRSAPAGADEP